MNHTFLARRKFDKRAELLNADNRSLENLSFFKIRNDYLNHFDSLVHHFLVSTAYGYLTVIGNIDFNTCTGDNFVNRLSSLTYDIANLLRVNLNGNNLRCIFSDFFSRLCDCGNHAVCHDKLSRIAASCNRAFYDRSCQTVNLNIHLNRCDSVVCTRYLKVHIAKEIFQTLNIREQYEIIIRIACHKTAGNTRYHLFNRHTCRHQRHTGSTGGSHGGRTVGFKSLGYGTNCIREFLLGRKYR